MLDVPPGEHTISVEAAGEGVFLVAEGQKAMIRPEGFGIVVVPIQRCRLECAGDVKIHATLDGAPLDGETILRVLLVPEAKS